MMIPLEFIIKYQKEESFEVVIHTYVQSNMGYINLDIFIIFILIHMWSHYVYLHKISKNKYQTQNNKRRYAEWIHFLQVNEKKTSKSLS